MKTFKVYIIWTNPLFDKLVRRLLDHPFIEVVGSSPVMAEGQMAIASQLPDYVIIEDGALDIETIAIMKAGTSVIQMNLENNELDLYHHSQRTLLEAGELFRLITDQPTDPSGDG